METVYPAAASALARGRRLRRAEPRPRHRTTPVTFAEIKEVDEENEEAVAEAGDERRRRPDVLDESLGRQFAEFRARRERRARRDVLCEREPDSPPPPAAGRAGSEPAAPLATAGRAGSEPAAPLVAAGRAGSEPAAPLATAGRAGSEPAAPLAAAGRAGSEPAAPLAAAGRADSEPAALHRPFSDPPPQP